MLARFSTLGLAIAGSALSGPALAAQATPAPTLPIRIAPPSGEPRECNVLAWQVSDVTCDKGIRVAPARLVAPEPQLQTRITLDADEPQTVVINFAVDAEGRAVAMTTSVESAFGNRVMSDGGTGLAGGFLLNNQLTDLSLQPTGAEGKPVANRVEAGKRPRSSMAPTLVFDRRGQLVMVAGSPGGPVIIHYVAKVLTGAGAAPGQSRIAEAAAA